jgi:hypothetical protein
MERETDQPLSIYEHEEPSAKLYQQGRIPDLSTRAVLQLYQQSHLVAKQEELEEGNDEFSLRSIFVHDSK